MKFDKQEILRVYTKCGGNKSATARELGVPRTTLREWLDKLDAEGAEELKPKILYFDIETAPMLAEVWQLWDNNVALDQLDVDWYILTWSAKWANDPTVYNDKLTNYNDWEPGTENDYHIVKSLRDMLDQASVVVGHNIVKFDIKKFNARCVVNGLPPPSPYKTVDTFQLAKAQFGFTSNRLDYLAKKLLGHGKIKTDHSLWKRCITGDKKAFEEMQRYNDRDVAINEEVHKRLAPWDKRSPNFGVFANNDVPTCSSIICGSTNVELTDQTYKTNTSEFEIYRCKDCGTHMRGKKNLRSKEQMKNMLAGI